MNSPRLSSDVSPILLAHVVVDLDGRASAIQRIPAMALRTGDPEMLACFHVIIISFEAASFETLETPTTPRATQTKCNNGELTTCSIGLAVVNGLKGMMSRCMMLSRKTWL